MLKRIATAIAAGVIMVGVAALPAAADCGPNGQCTSCWLN